MTDVSKAFDCLKHDLFIAKLDAYGFDYNSIKFINSYLTGHFKRVRINANYSSWFKILFGVPQGSILGPLVFNIENSDLFLLEIESDIRNYANDNSPFSCENDIESVIANLTNDCNTILVWLSDNEFVANPDKFHFISNSFDEERHFKVIRYIIASVKNFLVLRSTSNYLLKLTFQLLSERCPQITRTR